MTQSAPANIPVPADVQRVAEWVDEHQDGTRWGRYVRGSHRATSGVAITVRGWQDASGNVERYVSVEGDDAQLDAAALRRLAALVLDAADELDGLGNRFAQSTPLGKQSAYYPLPVASRRRSERCCAAALRRARRRPVGPRS